MEYRSLGSTGRQAGIIGLGGEYLDGKPYEVVEEVIQAALDGGINLMDVFMPGDEVRRNIGKALGSRRKDMMIQGHIGSVDLKEQYDISRDLDTCKRYFEKLLKHLNTDYIDFGMLFFLDNDQSLLDIEKNGIIRYAQELKEQGVVKGLGASSHNPAVARQLVETGLLDVLLFSVNPVFDMIPAGQDTLEHFFSSNFASQPAPTQLDPKRAELYTACLQHGVSITVMKTLAAGKLLSAEKSPFAQPMSVGQCIHYALSRPAVASVLIGAANAQQVQEALAYLELGEEEKDFAAIIAGYKGDFAGNCVYCNHCLPCPVSINIAQLHRCLDAARLAPQSIPESLRAQYAALPAHGGDCIGCGSCEKKCPFSVPVIQNMAAAKALLGY